MLRERQQLVERWRDLDQKKSGLMGQEKGSEIIQIEDINKQILEIESNIKLLDNRGMKKYIESDRFSLNQDLSTKEVMRLLNKK
jgi:hypothetical protein